MAATSHPCRTLKPYSKLRHTTYLLPLFALACGFAEDDAPITTTPEDDAPITTPPADDAPITTPPEDDAQKDDDDGKGTIFISTSFGGGSSSYSNAEQFSESHTFDVSDAKEIDTAVTHGIKNKELFFTTSGRSSYHADSVSTRKFYYFVNEDGTIGEEIEYFRGLTVNPNALGLGEHAVESLIAEYTPETSSFDSLYSDPDELELYRLSIDLTLVADEFVNTTANAPHGTTIEIPPDSTYTITFDVATWFEGGNGTAIDFGYDAEFFAKSFNAERPEIALDKNAGQIAVTYTDPSRVSYRLGHRQRRGYSLRRD